MRSFTGTFSCRSPALEREVPKNSPTRHGGGGSLPLHGSEESMGIEDLNLFREKSIPRREMK